MREVPEDKTETVDQVPLRTSTLGGLVHVTAFTNDAIAEVTLTFTPRQAQYLASRLDVLARAALAAE